MNTQPEQPAQERQFKGKRNIIIGAVVGLVIGLVVGAIYNYVTWNKAAQQAAESLGWDHTTPMQNQAVLEGSLICGLPFGAIFGMFGGFLGGLVSRKSDSIKTVLLVSVIFGAGFGLVGGLCSVTLELMGA
jgi:hypothetical protein